MFVLMTINEQYRSFLAELKHIYPVSEAANISSMVFENITGLTRSDVIKDPKRVLNETISGQLHDSLQRLKKHEPVQYVIGEAWFYKMKFKVSPTVLIPRPETEELVDEVITYLKGKPDASILDIGTGSGCIAISIKKNLVDMNVTAIDISEAALAIAKENAAIQQTDINFSEINFLDESTWPSLKSFDVIVSNPPYIPEAEKQLLDKNVTEFEPHLALFTKDDNPLIFYKQIAAFGRTHLKKDGKIFMEIHEDLAERTVALFDDDHYSSIIKKDFYEKQRMVIASCHYL